jgi:hypothetical protein
MLDFARWSCQVATCRVPSPYVELIAQCCLELGDPFRGRDAYENVVHVYGNDAEDAVGSGRRAVMRTRRIDTPSLLQR